MRGRIALATAVIAAVGLGAAGVAWASIPGSDGVIHGCYKNSGDNRVIVVDSEASCPSGYTALDWNQAGPSGPPGISGYEQVFRNWPGLSAGVAADDYVDCPAGKAVLGGGFDVTGSGDSVQASWPSNASPPGRWNVRVVPTVDLDHVTVFATCAYVS
jgi:hypothetical protein